MFFDYRLVNVMVASAHSAETLIIGMCWVYTLIVTVLIVKTE